uniref:NADH-ubiquinone oxidoreductase chain 5 n=1 Tax=Causus defilippii TaxID=88081 RepID=D0V5B6_CAUDE|nr:NADH dehydrogenase subunit 5 [Causus defilippii]ACY09605.1 NADH dehydrogenase subunit 5 [Causus defilippii]
MDLASPTITLAILLSPTLSILSPQHKTINMKYTLVIALLASMIPLISLLHTNNEFTISIFPLIFTQTENIDISFTLDSLSLVFISMALFITWSITEFSIWYMASDPNIDKFIKYLTLFLVAMIIIVTANNMYQLFIGWEGVGIMSFLLINWWGMRSNANTAALQAIVYNRIGDIGLIFTSTWLLTFSSINLQELLIQQEFYYAIPSMGLMMAAMGKSAQSGLHPWLPMAMEGPTPVSALLHSSTMVVAGVFLLIRLHPLLINNPPMKSACLIIGATTTMFAAAAATTQHDIKKIIALSTTSQLGLMMTMLGLNQPTLAFLHMTIHSFFKALLFLCSGSFIHNLNNQQDMRMMGNLLKTMPMTSSFTIIASLSLMGMPFLSGFYSKDLMIESMVNSYINSWALIITLVATALSASYSMQIFFFILTGPPLTPPLYHKESKTTIFPLTRLTFMSIFMGYMTKLTTLQTPMTVTMPTMTKLTALTMMITGVIMSKDFFLIHTPMPPQKLQTLSLFFNQLAFFNIPHRAIPYKVLKSSQHLSTELMDLWSLENYGPKGLSTTFTQLILLSTQQKTMIKNYMTTFSLTLLILLALPLF